MSTRSRIALQVKDNDNNIQYESIYCHWNGYPEYNGACLLKHYNLADKVQELINNGDLSCLKANINPTESHTFDNPQKGVCIFYGRDRGEENTNKKIDKTLEDLKQRFFNSDCEYLYLYSYNVYEDCMCWEYIENPYFRDLEDKLSQIKDTDKCNDFEW